MLYLFGLGGLFEILTILMVIDCAINRRELYWFFILVFLGPLGGIAYLIYHYQYVTFPFRVAQLNFASGGGGSGIRRCPRCFRQVDRLVDYEDGRRVLHLCPMCVAEMDFARSGTVSFRE